MVQPFGEFRLTAQDRRSLRDNVQTERSDYYKYMAQARATRNPVLRRTWQRFAQDELRHATIQANILSGRAAGAGAPWLEVTPPGADWTGAGLGSTGGGYTWSDADSGWSNSEWNG